MSETVIREREPADLAAIMDEMAGYHFEFERTLANHAPMVLVALSRLGASSERLRDFFETYREANGLFAVRPPVRPIDPAHWQDALGDREREADYRAFFAAEVERLGIDGALNSYLTPLAPGIGASALHALMRTAYAVLRQDDNDVAIALGYWASAYLEMPRATGAPPLTDDPAEVLVRTAAIEALHGKPEQPLLWHNMRQSGMTSEFAPVVDWLDVTL